ncbi:unnamed protein product [Dibothriocephalus latus]|uniref:Reverse transcriptase RNase H-like domain-containing protein n=1 Tax=Dibothriocephalus latus TaxID=60516 RepID=A0A3P7LS01_DIBLA|nr:unnamed protein product [Dibothriocephalus latus]
MGYRSFGGEHLAIYLTVKYFRHFLEGHEFTIFPDHNSLSISATLMARRGKWLTCCFDLASRHFMLYTGLTLMLWMLSHSVWTAVMTNMLAVFS